MMNLAAASGEDLATTSDIVTDALTAFGLKAEDSGHFADILAAASSNANTNVAMMGETFKYAAPIAGALGFSAEDTAEAIGLMANAGIKSSQAGTSLRTIMTALSGEMKICGENIGMVEIATTNADGSMRDLSDILADCRVAFAGLSESEKAAQAEAIAGKNAMSGFLALMNAAPEDVEKLSTAIDDCDGAAQRMAATMQDNLAGDITIFKSALEGAKIAISDGLTPKLREFVQLGTSSVSKLTTAFRNGGLTGAMSALGTVISDGLAMLTKVIPDVVKAGAELMKSLNKGIIDNLPLMVRTAVEILLMLANGIADNLQELIPSIVDVVLEIVDVLTEPDTVVKLVDAALKIILALADGLIKAIPKLIKKVPTIVANLKDAFIEYGPKILEAGITLLGMLGDGLIEGVGEAIKAIGTVLDDIMQALGDGFISICKAAIQWGKDLIASFTDGIDQSSDKPLEAIRRMMRKINPLLGGISSPLTRLTSNVNTYDIAPSIQANSVSGREFTVPRATANAINGQPIQIDMILDNTVIGRALLPYIEAERVRLGVNLVTGGVM